MSPRDSCGTLHNSPPSWYGHHHTVIECAPRAMRGRHDTSNKYIYIYKTRDIIQVKGMAPPQRLRKHLGREPIQWSESAAAVLRPTGTKCESWAAPEPPDAPVCDEAHCAFLPSASIEQRAVPLTLYATCGILEFSNIVVLINWKSLGFNSSSRKIL